MCERKRVSVRERETCLFLLNYPLLIPKFSPLEFALHKLPTY